MSREMRGELSRHGKPVVSVFDLLGTQENDLTAASGFTLARSRRLLDLLLDRLNVDAGHRPLVA